MVDQRIIQLMQLIKGSGFEVYIVGGAVRDYLLKVPFNDYDLTTNALPDELIALLAGYKIIKTGIKHGTITVITEDLNVEITTYRQEGIYLNHRQPSEVSFIRNAMEDVKRRDLTINGLLMDENEKIIDYVGGLADLKSRLIRTIGDPNQRLQEDALRILRTIRFAATLNFAIEDRTKEALFDQKHLLKQISAERCSQEFIKIVKAPHPEVLAEYSEILGECYQYNYHPSIKDTSSLIFRLALLFEGHPEEIDKLIIDRSSKEKTKELAMSKCSDLLVHFAKIKHLNLYLDYLHFIQDQESLIFYEENKDYIVSANNLAVDFAKLIKDGMDPKKIKKIKAELIANIRQKKIKNNKDEIMSFLKTLEVL